MPQMSGIFRGSQTAALQGAGALLSMCAVCVFRILNSKGWGLIMEPDSSSPASICLTVPPIFLSIPSLPLFLPFSVSNPLRSFLAVTLLRAALHLFCLRLSLPLSALLFSLSGPSVFQGHVRGVEEHVGVIVVVIAKVC